MRLLLCTGLLGCLWIPAPCSRAQGACSPAALPKDAAAVTALRHRLHHEAVGEMDPRIPASVALELGQLKDALARAAEDAFACAPGAAAPEELEKTLADALDANLSEASGTVLVTRDGKDLGAFGSDLAVHVLPMNNSPKFFQVNFRYGIECGDDNLLLVFEAGSRSGLPGGDGDGWNQRLRWDAPGYKTAGDAFGDFVLLTPLAGLSRTRNWRFVVAHGQPDCTRQHTQSRFDLDVLQPTDIPAHPRVVWHLERPYVRSDTPPRLVTTEQTLEFQIQGSHPGPADGPEAPAHPDMYRYRITEDNTVQDLGAAPDDPPQ